MYPSGISPKLPALTLPAIMELKRAHTRIVAATAYDATFGALLDRNGVDLILVGDSLGMVFQGRRNTLSVTMDMMVYHTAATARGVQHALLIADLPFASFPDPGTAFRNSARLLAEGGASMVKIEGDGYVLDCIRFLSEREIPVCAHLGLTPQSVHRLGGFKVQGRTDAAAHAILDSAQAVVQAGASLLVLECVPVALAAEVAATVAIPVIGIGAGVACDGQILVGYDLLGLGSGRRPRFVKNFLAGRGSADEAVQAYVEAVRNGSFPAAEHGY